MQKLIKSLIDPRPFTNRQSTIVCVGGNGTILTYRGVPPRVECWLGGY